MRTETKESSINIRAKAPQKEVIDIFLDQRLFLIDDEQINAFNHAIEASFDSNEKIQALLLRKSPWEK